MVGLAQGRSVPMVGLAQGWPVPMVELAQGWPVKGAQASQLGAGFTNYYGLKITNSKVR